MPCGRFGGGGHVPLLPPLGSGTVYVVKFSNIYYFMLKECISVS